MMIPWNNVAQQKHGGDVMEMMKRAVITGKKTMGIVDSPMPQPKEDWVLIKVRAIPL